MIWPILTLPDPRLREVCSPVYVFKADLRNLAWDLLDTMYELPSMQDVAKVVIDETVIRGETDPILIYQSSEPVAAESH